MKCRTVPSTPNRIGLSRPGRRNQPAGEQTRPGQGRGEDLARKGRAPGDAARLIGFLGKNALARQEGCSDQQPEGAEVQREPGRTAREGLCREDERRDEEKVDATTRPRAALVAKAGIGDWLRLALRIARRGAVFSAEPFGHHAPPDPPT